MSLQRLVSAGHSPDAVFCMTLSQFNGWLEAVVELETERMANWFPLLATATQGTEESIKKVIGVINGSSR